MRPGEIEEAAMVGRGDRGVGDALPIGPAPGGADLTFAVECSSASADGSHPVTLHSDWTLSQPHHLEAEAVVVAFGGDSPCLQLSRGLVPATRHVLGVMTRMGGQPVDTRWCPMPSCLGVFVHGSLEAAYSHEIESGHVAARFDLRPRQAELLLAAMQEAWLDTADLSLVAEGKQGYARLWSAAIHPRLVEQLVEIAPDELRPLPAKFFVDVAYRGADRAWLSEALRLYPDKGLAVWLAGNPEISHGVPLTEVAALRELGLPTQEARVALESGTSATTIRAHLQVSGHDLTAFMLCRAAWLLNGCDPSAEHYELMVRHRIPHQPPERARIDSTLALCRLVDDDVTRTEVGVMLALLGEPLRVATAVDSGITSALDRRLKPTATRGETI